MNNTKITVRLIDVLNNRLNKHISNCFIKRDQFVAHLIKTQFPSIRSAFHNKKLSLKAKRFISGNIKRGDTKLVNIQIDKDIAQELNQLVNEHNLVRDALINRIIFFAIADTKILKTMRIPTTIEDIAPLSEFLITLPIAPFNMMKEITYDPLFFLKEAFNAVHLESLYLIDFQNFGFKNDLRTISQLSCYIEDDQVPGTDAYEKLQQLKSLKIEELFGTTEGEGNV
jgi:adenylate kinase family enzyme